MTGPVTGRCFARAGTIDVTDVLEDGLGVVPGLEIGLQADGIACGRLWGRLVQALLVQVGFGKRRPGCGWLGRFALVRGWSQLGWEGSAPLLLGFCAGIGFGLRLGLRFRLFCEQCLSVRDRNLIIVGVDFAEGEETVTVAAVVHEGRLQRRLHARHFGKIDVAAQGFAGGRFVIELLYPAVAEHHHPGFFRVRGVDEHLIASIHVMGSLAPRRPSEHCS